MLKAFVINSDSSFLQGFELRNLSVIDVTKHAVPCNGDASDVQRVYNRCLQNPMFVPARC
jgi:hypothetical protein